MDGHTNVESKSRDFFYSYRSNGTSYRLRVPLSLPFIGNARELSLRLIKAHNLPCYLEDDLRGQVERFAREASLEAWDREAEEKLYGGSVFEKGSETDETISRWAECFSENHMQFASLKEVQDSDVAFSEVYHKLIHSPALETLLQLEHTYAMAVSELYKAWENARELMQTRHDAEQNEVLKGLGTTKTERDINMLMRQHTMEKEACEAQWSSELSQLQETQRREYREWVLNYEENLAGSGKRGAMEVEEGQEEASSAQKKQRQRRRKDPEPSYPPDDFSADATPAPLEESFTIHLGAQKKTMHNIRLLCGNPLDLCCHRNSASVGVRRGGGMLPNPERLQTAMTLYSTRLSALVVMVDDRLNSLQGLKEKFAKACHLSTDFHFPDIDVQLSQIQERALIAIRERRDRHHTATSLSSHNSDSFISRSESPSDTTDKGSLVQSAETRSPNSSQLFLSPDYSSSLHPTPAGNRRGSGSQNGGGGGHSRSASSEVGTSALMETTSASLEPGDFYITRHSNLSQVHVVMHLVTDEAAVQSSTLRARNPVMQGLKNCLRTAARHDIHNITVPLLLVHNMLPEMTINWCLKRAELVFKCVKGFMLENTSWGETESRTIQFLIPLGISEELFEEFCDMLPKVFRVSSTRNLTRPRTHSFK